MDETIHKMLNLSNESITRLISNIQSKFERRNAVKHIPNLEFKNPILGHIFERVLFTEPTCCSRCGEFITWDQFGDKGKRCKLCKLVSHDRCLGTIKSRCASDRESKSISTHKFKPKSFLKPTFCHHCGSLIMGIYKQGQECVCGLKIHHDCRKLVSDSCGQTDIEAWEESKIQDFELIRILATGSFGKVYLARRKNKQFAIKVVKKTHPAVSSDPQSTMTEMRVLQFGRSYPFLTIAHCCFQSRDRLFFVMEYVEGRDLLYHIAKARKFTEKRARFYSAEIVLALIYLHNRAIVYRDLKLDNVILDKHGHCKLVDFGMCKDLSKCINQRTRTFCGTPSYISPEICKGVDYDYSVDWWSLGVLMFEMLNGYPLFENYKDDDSLYRMIKEADVEYPPSLSNEAESILRGLLAKDPSQRLGCKIMDDYEQEILRHPFFHKDFTNWWEDLEAKRIEPPYKPTQDDLNIDHDTESNDSLLNRNPLKSVCLQNIEQTDFNGFSFNSESFDSASKLML